MLSVFYEGEKKSAPCEKFPLVGDELARPSAPLVTTSYSGDEIIANWLKFRGLLCDLINMLPNYLKKRVMLNSTINRRFRFLYVAVGTFPLKQLIPSEIPYCSLGCFGCNNNRAASLSVFSVIIKPINCSCGAVFYIFLGRKSEGVPDALNFIKSRFRN